MRREKVYGKFERLAFDYFYWFSRFEYCLKYNRFLKGTAEGRYADPDWNQFARAHSRNYILSDKARELLEHAPRRQVVVNNNLDWRDVEFIDHETELTKVVKLLKTVRNNLFHGGKTDPGGWETNERNFKSLNLALIVLHEIAQHGEVELI